MRVMNFVRGFGLSLLLSMGSLSGQVFGDELMLANTPDIYSFNVERGGTVYEKYHSLDWALFLNLKDNPRFVTNIDGELVFRSDADPRIAVITSPVFRADRDRYGVLTNSTDALFKSLFYEDQNVPVLRVLFEQANLLEADESIFGGKSFEVIRVDDEMFNTESFYHGECDLFWEREHLWYDFDLVIAPSSCFFNRQDAINNYFDRQDIIGFFKRKDLFATAEEKRSRRWEDYQEALEAGIELGLASYTGLVNDFNQVCTISDTVDVSTLDAILHGNGKQIRGSYAKFEDVNDLYIELTQKQEFGCGSLILRLQDKEELRVALKDTGVRAWDWTDMAYFEEGAISYLNSYSEVEYETEGQYLVGRYTGFNPEISQRLLDNGIDSLDKLDQFLAQFPDVDIGSKEDVFAALNQLEENDRFASLVESNPSLPAFMDISTGYSDGNICSTGAVDKLTRDAVIFDQWERIYDSLEFSDVEALSQSITGGNAENCKYLIYTIGERDVLRDSLKAAGISYIGDWENIIELNQEAIKFLNAKAYPEINFSTRQEYDLLLELDRDILSFYNAQVAGIRSIVALNKFKSEVKTQFPDFSPQSTTDLQLYLDAKRDSIEQNISFEAARDQILAAEVARVAEERKKKEAFNRKYPYVAEFSCRMRGLVNLRICFSGSSTAINTTIELNLRGSTRKVKHWQFESIGRWQGDKLVIDLPDKFVIQAQNASEHTSLNVTVTHRVSGKTLDSAEAAGRYSSAIVMN